MNGLLLLTVMAGALLTGCIRQTPPVSVPGHVEGEWRYLAAPVSGWIETLTLQEGDNVTAGSLAFRLDTGRQDILASRARARVRQAEEKRLDMKTGARAEELATIEAELDEARARLKLAATERQRQQKLVEQKLAPRENADQAQQAWETARARVRAIQARLASARLGGRPHLQAAAEAEVEALAKDHEAAAWQVDQRSVTARMAGRVERVFYHEGEYVLAGRPVLALLPPEGIKIRFYIPEPELARFKPGQILEARQDGAPPFQARLGFIAREAAYSPPVIFSTENRQKLVFMAEARPLDPVVAGHLHPGQPVDVMLP